MVIRNGFGEWGKLIFNFETGEYTYFANNALVEGDEFSFDFVVADNDGDVSPSATATVTIVDGKPVAYDDTDTIMPGTASIEGNVITGVGTDGGIALGDKATPFAVQAGGVDNAVDNAKLSSVTYNGVEIQFDQAFDILGGNGEVLGTIVFKETGYYQYTPSENIDRDVTLEAVDVTFKNYASLTDIENSAGIIFGSPDFYDHDGDPTTEEIPVTVVLSSSPTEAGSGDKQIGIDSSIGTDDARDKTIEGHEDLVIDFSESEYPDGVTNVTLDLVTGQSNRAMTITLYRTDGTELGQLFTGGGYKDNKYTPFEIPPEYTNIGRIVISAGSSTQAPGDKANKPDQHALGIFTGMTFDKITPSSNLDSAAEQHVFEYTLTDEDGQSDTATLTLNTIQNFMSGTDGDDLLAGSGRALQGTAANDYIDGLAGNDVIRAGGGHDILIGGAGADDIAGEDGNDNVSGGTGNDLLSGGEGNDVLRGEDGDDTLNGGNGQDRLYGGNGHDILNGGGNDDELFGDSGNDNITGGTGSDVIYGGKGNDTLTGGDGAGSAERDTFVFNLEDLLDSQTVQTDTIIDFAVGTDATKSDLLDISSLIDVSDADRVNVDKLLSALNMSGVTAEISADKTILSIVKTTSDSNRDTLKIELDGLTESDWSNLNSDGVIDGQDVLLQLLNNGQLIV